MTTRDERLQAMQLEMRMQDETLALLVEAAARMPGDAIAVPGAVLEQLEARPPTAGVVLVGIRA